MKFLFRSVFIRVGNAISMRYQALANAKIRRALLLLGALCSPMLGGCGKDDHSAPQPLPQVTAVKVIGQNIPEYGEYIGTTAATKSVAITARVAGFLLSQNFVDGAEVKQGDLLFVIDDRPFQAELDSALGQLAQDQAKLSYAEEQVRRNRELAERKFISRLRYDDFVARVREYKAAVASDQAAVQTARINLGYTRMYAAFGGNMGRRLYDVGNMVGNGQASKLAELRQLDPLYVYFSVSERVLPRLIQQQKKAPMKVTVLFADDSQHSYYGEVDFIDNVVDKTTGTVTLRALLPNPQKLLLPGQYVKVQLSLGDIPDALLVPDQAVWEEQAGQLVYVIDQKNRIAVRQIVAASVWQKQRVVSSGLTAGDRVVIEGRHKVHPGQQVAVTLIATGSGSAGSADGR